jgi:exopolysaccharide production protein ExoZ
MSASILQFDQSAVSTTVVEKASDDGHSPQPTGTAPLLLVQVLRAFAATLVLVGHIFSELGLTAAASGAKSPSPIHIPSGFGVDLFFAISGFIMVISSQRLYASADARRTFLTLRIIRVVPLYWFVTLAYVPFLLFGQQGFHGDLVNAIVTSFMFIPFPTYGVDGSSNVYPLYTLGWTLNYEIFFYITFSLFITLRRARALFGIVSVLLLVVFLGRIVDPITITLHFWSQPIVLEFGFGVCIGAMWLAGGKIDLRACLIVAICALCFVCLDPINLTTSSAGRSTPDDFRRVFGWGMPAAALLFAGAFAEKKCQFTGKIITALGFLGDCSYSLYLVHPFPILILIKIWKVKQLGSTWGMIPLGIAMLAFAYALAIFVHLLVEKPLTRTLRRLIHRTKKVRPSPA